MDARELKFLDCTFNTVTAFFSFMFIPPGDHEKVLQEIFRVLVPGGQFMMWDIEIQERPAPEQDMMVFPLQVTLPCTVINTGYGTPYTEKCIDDCTITLHRPKHVGFTWIEQGFAKTNIFLQISKAVKKGNTQMNQDIQSLRQSIQGAQLDMQSAFMRGSVGQAVSALIWLTSAALGTWASQRLAILLLVVGGMFIFPSPSLVCGCSVARADCQVLIQ